MNKNNACVSVIVMSEKEKPTETTRTRNSVLGLCNSALLALPASKHCPPHPTPLRLHCTPLVSYSTNLCCVLLALLTQSSSSPCECDQSNVTSSFSCHVSPTEPLLTQTQHLVTIRRDHLNSVAKRGGEENFGSQQAELPPHKCWLRQQHPCEPQAVPQVA